MLTTNLFAPLEEEAVDLVQDVRKSVVLVHSVSGHGSGVVWDTDGLIVTNHHVVGHRGGRLVVELANGRRLPATVVARDAYNDLAALRVDVHNLPSAPVGDSRTLRVGELIVAVGNPFGVRGAATLGIVSAVGVTMSSAGWDGGTTRELLQADVVLAPGNSGGPLVDTSGRVVGIASMILSPGIALAIPSHVVTRFLAKTTVKNRY